MLSVHFLYSDHFRYSDCFRYSQLNYFLHLQPVLPFLLLLAIEDKLSEVRYELENYGSQLRMLDNQIDYSTVNVDIDEVDRVTETGEKGFFEEIKDRFGDSLYVVGRGIRSFTIGFIGSLPIILVWAVIIVVIVIIVRSIFKKRNKKKEKKTVEETKPEKSST